MIQWTAHPAKRRPQDVMLAACIISLSAWAVLVGLGSAYLALVAVVLLVIAIAPFLLPTRYTLDDDGVREQRLGITRARPWAELRRVDVGPRAALVSPYAQRRWLDRYRGITLYFDGGPREEIVRTLKDRLA